MSQPSKKRKTLYYILKFLFEYYGIICILLLIFALFWYSATLSHS